MARQKKFLLRISPELWEELNRWAAQEFRSVNGQIEFLLQKAVNRERKGSRRAEGGGRRAEGEESEVGESPKLDASPSSGRIFRSSLSKRPSVSPAVASTATGIT